MLGKPVGAPAQKAWGLGSWQPRTNYSTEGQQPPNSPEKQFLELGEGASWGDPLSLDWEERKDPACVKQTETRLAQKDQDPTELRDSKEGQVPRIPMD